LSTQRITNFRVYFQVYPTSVLLLKVAGPISKYDHTLLIGGATHLL